MSRWQIISVLICLQFATNAIAQEDTPDILKDNVIEQKIETVVETDGNYDYTSLLDKLEYYKKHPINLNHTSKEELNELNILDDIQINKLMEHIDKNGNLLFLYELQTIDGFEKDVIQKILPYVTISENYSKPNVSFNELFKYSKNTIIIRSQQIIENEKGYSSITDSALLASPNSRYLGSKQTVYARYRFTYSNNISVGLTAQKDAGEEFFKGTQKQGFDFYSAHFYTHNIGNLKSFAVGDYQAQFGQGLTMWSGLAFGKSVDAMLLKRNARGISPYTSVDENLFLRGGAATIPVGKFDVTGFGSIKTKDANVTLLDSASNSIETVSSFQTTGDHNTAASIADKDVITEKIGGGNISYSNKNLKIGTTLVVVQYNTFLKRNLDYYNQFEFTGTHNNNLGLDYSYLWHNINIYGEASRSENGGMAFVNGAIISLDPRFSVSLFQRNYQRNFQPVLNNPIAESSKSANEKGLLMGVSTKPFPFITLTGYYDRFAFDWLRYQTNSSSYGNDFIVQLNYTPSKKTDAYLRIRQRNKEKNSSLNLNPLDYLIKTQQTNYRFNVSYNVTPSIKLRSRVELIDYYEHESTAQHGYMIYQDVMYKALSKPLSITFRYALFDTDGYDSRIYAYENDVLYSYSLPALSEKGSRTYLLLNYNVTRNIEVWLRYAQTFYNNKNIISEGSLGEIMGNTKSEIKAQIRFSF